MHPPIYQSIGGRHVIGDKMGGVVCVCVCVVFHVPMKMIHVSLHGQAFNVPYDKLDENVMFENTKNNN